MTTRQPDGASQIADTRNCLPRITVVTPSYNSEKYLESCIASVFDQNYPNLEYIIIDGGSTDDSAKIIAAHADRLAYWVSEPDAGQYHAINKGMSFGTGEVQCWLNSDDMLFPWSLQIVGEIFSTLPEVTWLTSRFPAIWSIDGIPRTVTKVASLSSQSLLYGMHSRFGPSHWGCVQQESTFWRRSVWAQVGGLDQAFSLAADGDLWLRFAEQNEIHLVEALLGGIRVHEHQRSRIQLQEYDRELHQALKNSYARTGLRNESNRWGRRRNILSRIPKVRNWTSALWEIKSRIVAHSEVCGSTRWSVKIDAQ